jgi:hypothetical protein
MCAMSARALIATIIGVAAGSIAVSAAQAFDDPRYPDWKGRWDRFAVPGLGGQPSFDQTKPWGLGQEAPLTPEYRAILEASLADQAKGGQGNFTGYACVAYGMPMMMQAFYPLEFIVTPATTYILVNQEDHGRRIYTDGRDWPRDAEPTYQGYSIGTWVDKGGEGRYDTLDVETRGPFKGPRVFDATGLPLHYDNQSVFKERIHLDKDNRNLLHDEITVIDHALTRPWTVDKKYIRSSNPRPDWPEFSCTENNAQVKVGDEYYYKSVDGLLMPTRADQPPPDLKYFKKPQK